MNVLPTILPATVSIVRLGDVIASAPTKRAGIKTLPVLSMTMRNGLVDHSEKFKKRVASEDTSSYKLVRRNQLVVGFPIDEGVLAFQRLYDEAIVSPAYDVWDIRREAEADPQYLERYLRSPDALRFFAAKLQSTTARRRTLPDDVFLSLPVPLPPVPAQRRTVAILEQADALRAKRRAALTQLDEMARAIFVEMFGDPTTDSPRFPLTALGSLGKLDRGVSKHRPRNAPELLGGPYPFIQTGDVSNCDGYIHTYKATYSEIGFRQSKMWPAGTLCITIAANIARVGILTFDACFPDSIVGFKAADPATSEYVRVWFTFMQERLEQAAPESTQKNINLEILRTLRIASPPMDLQREFAAKLIELEGLRSTAKLSSLEASALFTSLQHRAFRGEL